MKTNENPPHRWWSFRLWQLFAIITVLGCYFGYQVSVVRGRQAKLSELKRGYIYQVTTAEQWKGARQANPATVSALRRALGDEAVQRIGYYPHLKNDAELRRLARMFPEAELYQSDPPAEPCHPGCFPKGTLVDTPGGPRLIESMQVGEAMTAFNLQGEQVKSQVQSVFITTNVLIQIDTADGSLLTTKFQPLCLSNFQVIAAGRLQPGDVILRRVGEAMKPVKIIDITLTHRTEQVFNLVLGNSEIFVANGFLARSKPPRETTSTTNTTSHHSTNH